MRLTVKLAICAFPLMLLMGCKQKVDQKNTYALEPGDIKGVIVDAPKKEQKIVVTAKSSDGPVDVHLIEIKGNSEELDKLLNDKAAGNILAKQEKTQDAKLEGTVPGGSKFAVAVSNAKKTTSVDVHITNAK